MRELSYDPLWKKLIDARLTRTQLAAKAGFSRTTLAKMGKNEPVSMDVVLRVCDLLDCDVYDVMCYAPAPRQGGVRHG